MSGGIDRIHGPQDGVVELIIVLQQDWESDPFVVKFLREKVALYQEYLMGMQFRSAFANCRGIIVLETRFFPPEEVQRILAKEGVEIRISSDITPAPQAAVSSGIPAKTPHSTLGGATPQRNAVGASVQAVPTPMSPVASRHVSASPVPVPQPVAAPVVLPEPAGQESWEVDDEPGDMVASRQAGSSTGMYVALGCLVLSLLVVGYALMGMASVPPEVPPRVIIANSITARSFAPETHATLSVRPDRNAFVVVPIQDRAGKEEARFHILFGVKESPKLLVFAAFADSQIPVRVEYKANPSNPEMKDPVMVWGDNVDNLPSRTYTGRLERLQRYDNGPLELKLPGGNQDVNQLYRKLSKVFPDDSMLLVVGEKPAPPKGSHGIILLVGLLGCLVAGGAFLVQRSRANRSF